MDITVIIALITACAAIAAPVVTAQINSKAMLKVKRIELSCGKLFEATQRFSEGYANLHNSISLDSYWTVLSAAYEIMSLVDDAQFQTRISLLIDDVIKMRENESVSSPGEETDRCFHSIMRGLATYSTHLQL